jgi:uncharacterized protein YfdQ (DUF2303 family)
MAQPRTAFPSCSPLASCSPVRSRTRGRSPFVLVPKDHDLQYLEEEAVPPLPDFIRQNVTLTDLESFVAYVKGFATHTTTIFAKANEHGGSFTAVLDYHEGGKDGQPRRAAHVATYPCPLSVEWRTWLAKNGAAQKQEAFAEFIDANAADVIAPDSAVLLELALNFEMRSNVNFQSDIRRTTGGKTLKFTEEIEAGRSGGGEMKVPDSLKLRLPVFEGGKAYEIDARLEFRVNGGKLTIAYILRRPHEVVRKAIADLRADVAAATGIAPLSGEIQ